MHESGKAVGQTAVKPSLFLQASVIKAAHKHDVLTVAHATSVEDTIAILEAGVDGLAHTIFDEPINEQLIEQYKKSNAFCIPTLTVIGSLTGEGQEQTIAFANDERVSGILGESAKQNLCECTNFAAPMSRVEYAFDSVRQLKKAGVDILW